MTQQTILIAGSGFAGMWAALSASRAIWLADKQNAVQVVVVSPAPELHIRPRLYETAFADMAPDLSALFDAIGVQHIAGRIETVRADRNEVDVLRNDGQKSTLHYDRFVLATGSSVFSPDIPGLKEHSFDVDQLPNAIKLDQHLRALNAKPQSAQRDTVVIVGGGFTGIEAATEMPQRLREYLGADAKPRVVVVEQAADIGPDLGPGPRPLITEALAECGAEVMTSTGVVAIDANGVTLSNGARIEASTVIWTAGMRAHPLTAQIAGERDRLGRLHADRDLRAQGVANVFVAGDVAHAATDDLGNVALMSCQHALSLGRVAGHNAAAELLGQATHPYSQPKYVTCLDLGPWGAVYCEGWDRQVLMKREDAKNLKRSINTQWIYPPKADREAAFAVAAPNHVIVA